jgi:formamidopyrimidine-DNA glycosylase
VDPVLPELPEVETMRRGVLPVVGSLITQAQRPECRLRPILLEPSIRTFDRRVRGQEITDIGRRGKRVMIHLGNQDVIVIEPRMTGLVLLADPPGPEHLRLRLTLTGGQNEQLLFWDRRGLGTVRLLSADEVQVKVDDKLGPDALVVTHTELKEKLKTSRREIKVALLDQSVVAGIGNLYAAEILFLSGIDPRTNCDCLTGSQWERIQTATHAVLQEAIEHEGSTLSDGTYRNALNGEGGYQNYHRVYDRVDQSCIRCKKGRIRRIVQAQRSTFFCPKCQQRRGLHHTIRTI